MNLQDVAAHWVALHEALGLGAPIASEAEYERALSEVDQMVDATDGEDSHPLWGLIAVAGDRIRAYEAGIHPWPDSSSPSAVLASLMQEHALRQADLPEIGSQGVVSEVLAGKRQLNARQIAALAKRFAVPADVFLP
ncbi:MAG: transcriptional regulator [Rubrivivax sp.]|jgi:HTH-type transcriptional regulator/antitoxin HigA|nr:transcriptional regulator [Rubrivivax sp.]